MTTDPPLMSVEIRDGSLRVVAQGVSPMQAELKPGLHMVTAVRPGAPNLVELVKVRSAKSSTIKLTDKDPTKLEKVVDAVAQLAPAGLRSEPAPKLESAPLPAVKPLPFHMRFLRLKGWDESEPIEIPNHSVEWDRGTATVALELRKPGVVFAQIACEKHCPLNVELPRVVGPHVDSRLRITPAEYDLKAIVEFQTPWANAVAQYMAQGYLEEAKQVFEESQNKEQEEPASGLGLLLRRALNFFSARAKDPAAALISRYLRLRLGEVQQLEVAAEMLADVMYRLTDGHIIRAEFHARMGKHKIALSSLRLIPQGQLPLFTEGFSMAVSRLRQYSQQRFETDEISDDEAAQAKELLNRLNVWSPVVDLNSVTLTFAGADLTNPSGTLQPVAIDSDAYWRHFTPK